tara:strand:+ start:954 stop:2357 length:1404 start_codon:yes stop_codon:yes gene_type:complete
MPSLTAADHQNILSVLQHSLNGDTSVLIPSGQAFYVPGTSVPLSLNYDGFVTKRGTLSESSPASGAILVLESAAQAAQFRAGDVCYLVGNAFAGAVNASDNTADQVTVSSVSGQQVIVTGRAGGIYSVGASLVVLDQAQPGGYAGGTSDGPAIGNQALGELLAALEAACGSTGTAGGGGHSATTIKINNPASAWDEEGAMVGATITMLTATAANNVGVSAKVVSTGAGGNPTVILTLADFKDSDGVALTQWPTTPSNGDTISISLDTSEGKIAELQQAGGDWSVGIAAMLTMHRRLDEAKDAPEIPLIDEWKVSGQKTGAILRLKMPEGRLSGNAYTDASDTSITVEMDPAVGDIPAPLSGRLRVINAQDGVGSTPWNAVSAPLPSSGAFVSYTRLKKSNVLNLGAAGVLGSNIPGTSGVGRVVEIEGASCGFASNSGFAPQPDNKYLVGLLYQLVNAVHAYKILGA